MPFPIIPGGSPASTGYQVSRSLRFRRSAVGNITRTFGTPTTQNTFSFSCWTKRGLLSTLQIFFGYSNLNSVYFTATDTIALTNGSTTLQSTAVYRDPSAWYHILYTQSGTTANIYVNGTLAVTGTCSVSFNTASVAHCIGSYSPASASYDGYIAEVYFVDGQAKAVSDFTATDATTGVISPKAYTGTYGNNGFYLPFNNLNSTSQNLITYSEQFDNAAWQKPAAPVAPTITANSTTAPNGTTTADTVNYSGTTTHPCYQETSVSVANGSTITTSMYVKASSGSSFLLQCALMSPTAQDNYAVITFTGGVATSTPYAANLTTTVVDVGNGWYRVTATATNQTGVTATVCRISIGQNSLSGVSSIYVWGAQMNYGSAYPPYIATVASAQTSATTNLGADYQLANGGGWNNWLSNNISLSSGTTYDSMIDSPTNYSDGTAYGRGNYATLNAIVPTGGTYSNGNLRYIGPTAWTTARSTIELPSSGKWYFEATAIAAGQNNLINSTYSFVGVAATSVSPTAAGYNAVNFVILNDTGWLNNNATTSNAVGAALATNDVIGIAIDVGANTFTFYRNNTSVATGTIGMTAGTPLVFVVGSYSASYGNFDANFGQRPFAFTPPSGYSALNTQNLPAPALTPSP